MVLIKALLFRCGVVELVLVHDLLLQLLLLSPQLIQLVTDGWRNETRSSKTNNPNINPCSITKHTDRNLIIRGLHVLSLLYVEQVLALHGLLQQGAILQHQSLDLIQQVAVLLLQVPLQLAEQLKHTNEYTHTHYGWKTKELEHSNIWPNQELAHKFSRH